MIYFLEHDASENICHVCADPMATIVPLINRVTFKDNKGNALKDASGNDLSPFGQALQAPAAISQADYTTLVNDGMDKYTYSPTTRSITLKPAPPAPPATTTTTTTTTTSTTTS